MPRVELASASPPEGECGQLIEIPRMTARDPGCVHSLDLKETLLGGLSPNKMVAWDQCMKQYANETLATSRPLGLIFLGSRRRSVGVPERNLDRGLETLL